VSAPELRFQEPTFHDDDIAAKGDDTRDQDDTGKGWRPRPEDLA
jgi:hypothetical protein